MVILIGLKKLENGWKKPINFLSQSGTVFDYYMVHFSVDKYTPFSIFSLHDLIFIV